MTREEFLGALPARSTDERIELARALDLLLAATERNALERAAAKALNTPLGSGGAAEAAARISQAIRALIPGKGEG